MMSILRRAKWNWLWQFCLGNTEDGEVRLSTKKVHHREILERFWEIVAEKMK